MKSTDNLDSPALSILVQEIKSGLCLDNKQDYDEVIQHFSKSQSTAK